MSLKKEVGRVALFLIVLILLISPTLAVLGNTPPKLTITSMNLNAGTSRDISSFISDDDGDRVICTYCIMDKCYSTCRIYAPMTPGIHKVKIYMNDSKELVSENMTVFVPGEIPDVPVKTVIKQNYTDGDFKEALENTINNQTNNTKPEENISEEKSIEVLNQTTIIYKDQKFGFSDILIIILILAIIGAIIYFIERDQRKQRTKRQQEIKYLGEIFPEDKEEDEEENFFNE